MNEQEYLNTLEKVFSSGRFSEDRTGVGTVRLPGASMKFNLYDGFPVLTTKKVLFYPMLVELLWFLQGRNDLKWLQDRKCNIWNQWHDKDHTIGPGYGVQWRKWKTENYYNKEKDTETHYVDQIKNLISGLKNNPDSRRHIVNAWNVHEIDKMALPPCHFSFQFIVIEGLLHCILSQRSGDMFLGVPFNISSYALLTQLIAKECNLIPGTLTHNIGDAHIYANHIEQVKEQLGRKPKPLPKLVISDKIPFKEKGLLSWLDNDCKDLSLSEIKELFYLEDYDPHPFIKAPVAV